MAGGPEPPLKSQKHIGFPSNTGPDLLKNHRANKPTFYVAPAKRYLNGVLLAADDGWLKAELGSSLPLINYTKKLSKLDTL